MLLAHRPSLTRSLAGSLARSVYTNINDPTEPGRAISCDPCTLTYHPILIRDDGALPHPPGAVNANFQLIPTPFTR